MFHHVSVGTNNLTRAERFYDAVMPTVDWHKDERSGRNLTYRLGGFYFDVAKPLNGGPATVGNGSHVSFFVGARGMVDAFYRTALDNGGSDAGEPGVRPHYNANYYGAFVYDPDGNKIEAVTYSAD